MKFCQAALIAFSLGLLLFTKESSSYTLIPSGASSFVHHRLERSTATTTIKTTGTYPTRRCFMSLMPDDSANPRSTTPDAISDYYARWCIKNGKRYDPDRLPIFTSNFIEMQEYMRETGQRNMEMNEYSDLSVDEYNSRMGRKRYNPPADEATYERRRSPRDKAPNPMMGTNNILEPPPSRSRGPTPNEYIQEWDPASRRQQQPQMQNPEEDFWYATSKPNRGDQKNYNLDPRGPGDNRSAPGGNIHDNDPWRDSANRGDQQQWPNRRRQEEELYRQDFEKQLDEEESRFRHFDKNFNLDPPPPPPPSNREASRTTPTQPPTSSSSTYRQNSFSDPWRQRQEEDTSRYYTDRRRDQEPTSRRDEGGDLYQRNFETQFSLDPPPPDSQGSRANPPPAKSITSTYRQSGLMSDPWRSRRHGEEDGKYYEKRDQEIANRREISNRQDEDEDLYKRNFETQFSLDPPKPVRKMPPTMGSTKRKSSDPWRRQPREEGSRRVPPADEADNQYKQNFETQFSLDPPKPIRKTPPTPPNPPSTGSTYRENRLSDPWRRQQGQPKQNQDAIRRGEEEARWKAQQDQQFEEQYGHQVTPPSSPHPANSTYRPSYQDTGLGDPWRRQADEPTSEDHQFNERREGRNSYRPKDEQEQDRQRVDFDTQFRLDPPQKSSSSSQRSPRPPQTAPPPEIANRNIPYRQDPLRQVNSTKASIRQSEDRKRLEKEARDKYRTDPFQTMGRKRDNVQPQEPPKTMQRVEPTQRSRLSLSNDYKDYTRKPKGEGQMRPNKPDIVQGIAGVRPNSRGQPNRNRDVLKQRDVRDQDASRNLDDNAVFNSRSNQTTQPRGLFRKGKDAMERIQNIYRKWCSQFGKKYDETRLPIFAENFKTAEEYQKSTGKPMSLDGYSDLSMEEFMAMREAKAKAKQGEEDARREADRLEKQRLEDEAARYKAIEETEARKEVQRLKEQLRLEEEARRKAEEAIKMEADRKERIRLQEEEARRAEEEKARRQAEEEARRKQAAEARMKLEEEARRKAEEDARRRAERKKQSMFDLMAVFEEFDKGGGSSTGFDASFSTNKERRKIRYAYIKWCDFYDKKYDESRLNIFASNVKQVTMEYEKTGVSMKLNEFADRTVEEYHALQGITDSRKEGPSEIPLQSQPPGPRSRPSNTTKAFQPPGPTWSATGVRSPTTAGGGATKTSPYVYSGAPNASPPPQPSAKSSPPGGTVKKSSFTYSGLPETERKPSPPTQPKADQSPSTPTQPVRSSGSYMDHLSPPRNSTGGSTAGKASYIYTGPQKSPEPPQKSPEPPVPNSSSYLDELQNSAREVNDQVEPDEPYQELDLRRITYMSLSDQDEKVIREAMRMVYGCSKSIEDNCVEGAACPSAEFLMRTLPDWLYPYFPETFFLDIERGA